MKKPGGGRAWWLRLQRIAANVVLALFPYIRRGRVCGVEFVDDGSWLQRLQSLNLCLSVEQHLPGVPQLVAVAGPTFAVDRPEDFPVLRIHVPIADQVLKLGASLGELVVAGGGAIAGDLGHYPFLLHKRSTRHHATLAVFDFVPGVGVALLERESGTRG